MMENNELASILNAHFNWHKSRMCCFVGMLLSVVYKGIAIPLFWRLLPKRGNSDTAERIEIIGRFINQFGKDHIGLLLADREFVGNDWFDWLIQEGIHFCIRIVSMLIKMVNSGH